MLPSESLLAYPSTGPFGRGRASRFERWGQSGDR